MAGLKNGLTKPQNAWGGLTGEWEERKCLKV